MRRLTRRIILIASATCVLLGLFLLGANFGFIPPRVTEVAVDLWPVALVACGVLLVVDSLTKRRRARLAHPVSRRHELPMPPNLRELAVRLQFSYGRLRVSPSSDGPALTCTGVGSVPEPTIQVEERAGVAQLAVSLVQPLFPAHVQLANAWDLRLPPTMPVALDLQLHETVLELDLRGLEVPRLDLHADLGAQEVLLGDRQQHLQARIWSSSADLTVVVPAGAWVEVRLLNPFCRIDYPQGDFERTGDGSLVSRGDGSGSAIEIALDGALRGIVLDVEEPAEP